MKFSIIIPTCNRATQLEECIMHLRLALDNWLPGEAEMIVTDDSTNVLDLAAWLTDDPARIRYVTGPRRGPAANRNHGTALAQGEWFIFIDDDCLPDPHLLKAYAQAIHHHPESKAFEGAVHPDDWEKLKQDMAECPVNTNGGCFWTANVCIRADLFRQVGGFDEQFLMAAQEDQDMYLRIKPLTTVVFVPDAKVLHPVRVASLGQKIRRMPAAMRNWELYYAKHFSKALALKQLGTWFDYQKSSLRSLLQHGQPKKFLYQQANAWYALMRSITLMFNGS